jgi:hypothetical protein
MAIIAGFTVVDVAVNLSLVRLPPLLSPFYCYLLSLLLLLCLLLPVLTAK